MTETLYALGNLVILPFWGLMILLPGWRWTQRIIASPWIAAPPALLYAALLLSLVSGQGRDVQLNAPSLAAFSTAAGLAGLLNAPGAAATVWLHLLALDLFAGRWAYLDSRERGLSPWLMAPVLFFILMAGPLGLLIYLGVRTVIRRAA